MNFIFAFIDACIITIVSYCLFRPFSPTITQMVMLILCSLILTIGTLYFNKIYETTNFKIKDYFIILESISVSYIILSILALIFGLPLW